MPALQPNRKELQQGFSLFEVLITIVVISIGLLGLAGLQFAGLRAANNAHEHTLATILAQDIEERIRANAFGATSLGAYNSVTLNSGSSPPPIDCTANPCFPGQMAQYDRYQWYRLIVPAAGDIPLLSNASISVSSNNGITFLTTIQWGDSGNPHTLTTNFNIK